MPRHVFTWLIYWCRAMDEMMNLLHRNSMRLTASEIGDETPWCALAWPGSARGRLFFQLLFHKSVSQQILCSKANKQSSLYIPVAGIVRHFQSLFIPQNAFAAGEARPQRSPRFPHWWGSKNTTSLSCLSLDFRPFGPGPSCTDARPIFNFWPRLLVMWAELVVTYESLIETKWMSEQRRRRTNELTFD